WQDQCLAEELRDVSVLAHDEWPGQRAPLALLGAFVTPNHSALLPLLSEVQVLLRAAATSDVIDGYQRRSKERALHFVRAAFACVAQHGLKYIKQPYNLEREGQRIRAIDTLLREQSAHSLEACTLSASLLECMGLRPLLVLLQQQALVAV